MASRNHTGVRFLNKAEGFDHPTRLPRDAAEHDRWQLANRTWWESTPMRYDWRDEIEAPPGSRAYFEEIDARFLASVRKYMAWRVRPFEDLIPYAELPDRDVLEIGTGQGTHAQLIAPHCRSFVGIDLTSAAAQMTAKRLELFSIPGKALQVDAERMPFPDKSFDYIWSWGVIHHSADTRAVLKEMNRVLRPGGTATVMVYHRSWWHFYLLGTLRRAFQREFRSVGDVHRIVQGATDGAIARYYTPSEWRRATAGLFDVTRMRVYGLKAEVLPLPNGKLKAALEERVPDALTRLMTNRLRFGSFLVADMRKAHTSAA